MIKISLMTHRSHCAQICTGFERLYKGKELECIEYEDHCFDSSIPNHTFPIVEVKYHGKTLMYDTEDGYNQKVMQYYLDKCDYYFKRSYSSTKNEELFSEIDRKKIYPLGLGYEVYTPSNPYCQKNKASLVKYLLGKKPCQYFSVERFEGCAQYKTIEQLKIIFFCRLWEERSDLTQEKNDEREYINETRVAIIRRLKKIYGDAFIGGLYSNSLAKKMAPEIIVSRLHTERSQYLKKLHAADIAIGTMGLHESIGWKTAEYVASGKAIVNEKLHYEVPGDFKVGKNYLEFSTVDECINNVEFLVKHPFKVYEMKCRNLEYYMLYMKPEIMIKRTLDIVDSGEL